MIDLRSDTVTRPTPAMLEAMVSADVGDDVYSEDPTVNLLQEKSAELFHRDASLFMPTGSMGNQVAIKLHTKPGQEVISEAKGHIYNYEMAAVAAVSGCLVRPVETPNGILEWSLVEPVLSPDVYYRAKTGLIAMENTHNMAGGKLLPLESSRQITSESRKRGIPVHLDGARIFNAAAASGHSVAELSEGCDSVMFCLSKGLGAPVGSMLVGDQDFITEARAVRKLLGGGMRQVGVLAAAGLNALETMPQRLYEDHLKARILADTMAEIPLFSLNPSEVETNILVVDLNGSSSVELTSKLRDYGVLACPTGPYQMRFVTHRDVSMDEIEQVRNLLGKL
ncbi:MAG: GntG family PLP-dependent aldolase [Acidobacteriota bacterium]